jgi:hypothetical protein
LFYLRSIPHSYSLGQILFGAQYHAHAEKSINK